MVVHQITQNDAKDAETGGEEETDDATDKGVPFPFLVGDDSAIIGDPTSEKS